MGEFFIDDASRVPPFQRDNGNVAIGANFFSCLECTDNKRFLGYYVKYSEQVRAKIEEHVKSRGAAHLVEGSYRGRLISLDGEVWVPAESVKGSGIISELQKKCSKGSLRLCYPE